MQFPRSLTDSQNTSRRENFRSFRKLKYDMMMISEPVKDRELSIIVINMRVRFCLSVKPRILPSPYSSSSSPIPGEEALREFVKESGPAERREFTISKTHRGRGKGGAEEWWRGEDCNRAAVSGLVSTFRVGSRF